MRMASSAPGVSASVKAMAPPGPTPEQLAEILQCAVRVPDHGKLTPWRFILWEGAARAAFGETLKARCAAMGCDALAPTSPADFAEMVKTDVARWTKVVRATGLKFD